MAPHTGSATPEQITTLLNFLDEHRDLARGLLRGGDGSAQAKRLWGELCNTLNAMGGCTKTTQQWQKVWFDRKHLAKKAAADFRRSASATGGGPSMVPPLSNWQLKVLSIMGDGFGGRQTQSRSTGLRETNEPMPSTSSQSSQPLPNSVDWQEVFVEYAAPSPVQREIPEPASQLPVPQEPLTPTLTRQSTRPRRRHSNPASDVRSRLYEYEEGRSVRETTRNTELAGIRAALEQLTNLVREYLDNRI